MSGLTYLDAGVDIDKADSFINLIRSASSKTKRDGVIGEIGGFGGLFSLNSGNYKKPVLVSSTDGVGTKLKIAFMMDKHDTVGIDLVAMCVNDIAVQGAEPLFFLDYLATGKLDTQKAMSIVEGIAEGCRQANCALIGGETAEMPDMYAPDEYDLAGFSVGVVEEDNIIDGSKVSADDVIVGIASSGLHSNGFSLVRKICFEKLSIKVTDYIPELGNTLGEELLTPTKIYSTIIQEVIKTVDVHGMAHITGGGIIGNIRRVIPEKYDFKLSTWEVPPIFKFLKSAGIETSEMLKVFNNGIGLAIIVDKNNVDTLTHKLRENDEEFYVIGEICTSVK